MAENAQGELQIGIIVGSIREGRKGSQVGRWIADIAAGRNDAQYALLELADYELPLLTDATVPGGANRQYDSEARTRWGRDIDLCDAFVFVTAEYNHGVPGAFKNAFDSLGTEWAGKAVAFVSYGAESGVRAVEHWRQIVSNFSMGDVRQQVSVNLFAEFGPEGFTPNERRADEFATLLDQLLTLTGKLRG